MPAGTARQRVRGWLKDGRDNARPSHGQVEVTRSFPLLLRWVISWWQGSTTLPLAIDAVTHQDRGVALVISVLYRGCATPVAWFIVPAQGPGAWMPHILTLIDQLHPAIPAEWHALVLVDRGQWGATLWHHLQQRRRTPLVRIAADGQVRPVGWKRTVTPAVLVPKVGHAWVGRAAIVGKDARQVAILVVV
jgi:hypothetical protein